MLRLININHNVAKMKSLGVRVPSLVLKEDMIGEK